MIIKVDLDGVIRDIFTEMCKLYNEDFNEKLTVDDITDYDVNKVFSKVQDQCKISAADYFFKFNARRLFLQGKPYDCVIDSLNRLKDKGHKIILATWQTSVSNKADTLYFLELNNIPYDDICFTRDKWMIYSDWIIDDNPEFITDNRETASKIIIDMPYNKNVYFDGYRVKDLKEAVDLILLGMYKTL